MNQHLGWQQNAPNIWSGFVLSANLLDGISAKISLITAKTIPIKIQLGVKFPAFKQIYQYFYQPAPFS